MKIVFGMAALLLTAACSTPDTAMKLAREQQALQMAAREAEARTAAGEVASEAQVYLSMIRRLQQDGRYFASLAHIDSYQNRYGMTPELAVLRADALRVTEQSSASATAYRALLDGPRAATGWHGLGLLAGARGQYPEAAQHLARAAALEPTNVDMLNDLGFARLRSGDVAGARLPLAQAAELAPTNAKVLANLALLLTLQGERERALQIMDRASMPERTRQAVLNLATDIQAHEHTPRGPAAEPVTLRPASLQAYAAPAHAVPDRPIVAAVDGPHASGAGADNRAAAASRAAAPASAAANSPLPVLEATPTLSLFERLGRAGTVSQ